MLTISHDIKAPVSSILGYLDLYMESLKRGRTKGIRQMARCTGLRST